MCDRIDAAGGGKTLWNEVAAACVVDHGREAWIDRVVSDVKAKATCIIGTGAVEGAWDPVLSAVRDIAEFRHVETPDGANAAMARLVFLARNIETWKQAEVGDDRGDLAKENVAQVMGQLRSRISENLKRAHGAGTVRVRHAFRRVIREFLEREVDAAYFLTTNWDPAVEVALGDIEPSYRPMYIHGSTQDPSCMHLPAEVASEPYRTVVERDKSLHLHRQVMNCVDESTHLVLYGLSLSPLDAELSQMIASGTHKSGILKITVVDPRFIEVIERVRSLIDLTVSRVEIHGYDPDLPAGRGIRVFHEAPGK